MLAAVTCYFNPCNFQNLKKNYFEFRENLKGIDLFTIELSFDGEFDIPDALHIQGNEDNWMWQKERLLNILVETLPAKYDKIAWIDADIIFQNENWVADTEKLLDEVAVCQLFRTSILLDEDGEILAKAPSMCALLNTSRSRPGYAWAARRELFPLYDRNIVGGGDTAMFFSWLGRQHIQMVENMSVAHRQSLNDYHKKVFGLVKGRIGHLPDWIIHLWHGTHKNRQYMSRHQILKRHDYDPENDIILDDNGLWKWNSYKPKMHQEVRSYFRNRKEDGVQIENLAIVSCHFNPFGFKKPVENCKRFLEEIGHPVTLVELSFNGKFEFEDSIQIQGDLQKNLMWQKERLINIGIQSLPKNVDAVAWIDADLIFRNPNWYEETKKLLNKHQIVQLYEGIDYLDENKNTERSVNSYMQNQILELDEYSTPGAAWAARRDSIPDGIFDEDIVGGSDALFIAGNTNKLGYLKKHYNSLKYTWENFPEYQKKQLNRVNKPFGMTTGRIVHLWHGTKANRQYHRRLEILQENNFKASDIKIGENGLWEWNSDKPELHQAIADYFQARQEDGV